MGFSNAKLLNFQKINRSNVAKKKVLYYNKKNGGESMKIKNKKDFNKKQK